MAESPQLTIDRLRRAGLGAFFRPRDVEPLGISELYTESTAESPMDAEVVVDERLGGLLRSYRYSA